MMLLHPEQGESEAQEQLSDWTNEKPRRIWTWQQCQLQWKILFFFAKSRATGRKNARRGLKKINPVETGKGHDFWPKVYVMDKNEDKSEQKGLQQGFP